MAGIGYAVPAPTLPVPAPQWVGLPCFGQGTTAPSGTSQTRSEASASSAKASRASTCRSSSSGSGKARPSRGRPSPVRSPNLGPSSCPWRCSRTAARRRGSTGTGRSGSRCTHAGPGRLTVSAGGAGAQRSLQLRLVPDDHAYDTDPAMAKWAKYVPVLVADQPFWAGETIQETWRAPGCTGLLRARHRAPPDQPHDRTHHRERGRH